MYQALYRKYRPRIFDDVAGQEHITVTLKNQVASGRLSHAYLFIGTRGTGKTSCAKILARAVNCLSPEDGNPCNKCSACLGIEDGSILDVVELDAASNNGVDNVRALRDEAVFTPASVKKRVYIVDEVHMLSTAAFNALLKILEEPPPHLLFILATTELQRVPATIMSRCQRHSFRRIGVSDISGLLRRVADNEEIEITGGAVSLLARLADGSMRDALSLLDQCAPASGGLHEDVVLETVGLSGSRKTAELLENILAGQSGNALDIFDTLWKSGKSPSTVLSEIASLLRDILITHIAPGGGGNLLSGSYQDADLSGFTRAAGEARLMRALEEVGAALSDMRNSANPRLTAELCFMKLSNPLLGGDIPALEARICAVEERLGGISAPVPAQAPKGERAESLRDIPTCESEESPGEGDADSAPPWDAPPETPDSPAPEPVVLKEEWVKPEEASSSAEAFREEESSDAGSAAGPDFRKLLCDNLAKDADIGSVMILSNPALSAIKTTGNEITIEVDGEFAYNLISKPDFLDAVKIAARGAQGAEARISVKKKNADAPRRSVDELSRLENVVFED